MIPPIGIKIDMKAIFNIDLFGEITLDVE
ncbi:MAG: hypothetical protein DK303_001244 [Chloroflexi bacterium]|nr:MAG: hypothetical protein DK303_001244 [Chloroflexota bacterium]